MEEVDRKGSGGPVIASRSEAIQRLLSGLPRGWSPSQWRLIPCQVPPATFFWQEAWLAVTILNKGSS